MNVEVLFFGIFEWKGRNCYLAFLERINDVLYVICFVFWFLKNREGKEKEERKIVKGLVCDMNNNDSGKSMKQVFPLSNILENTTSTLE